MNTFIKYCLFCVIGLIFIGAVFALQSNIAQAAFTRDELNACAAEAAFQTYLKWENGDAERAATSLALVGYYGILEKRDVYRKSVDFRTLYDEWADEALGICKKHRAKHEPIKMPHYGVPHGYHISRSIDGSASIVKDGDPEPQFRCIDGYHDSGIPARPDGSGGCQPNAGGGSGNVTKKIDTTDFGVWR